MNSHGGDFLNSAATRPNGFRQNEPLSVPFPGRSVQLARAPRVGCLVVRVRSAAGVGCCGEAWSCVGAVGVGGVPHSFSITFPVRLLSRLLLKGVSDEAIVLP